MNAKVVVRQLVCGVAAVIVCACGSAWAGKPAPPPPPLPFPVRYNVQFIEMPGNGDAQRINNARLAIGKYWITLDTGGYGSEFFVYDAATGDCHSVRDLLPSDVDPTHSCEFTEQEISPGGKVVGDITYPNGQRWAYVLDTFNAPVSNQCPITIYDANFVKDKLVVGETRGRGVNDTGDVLLEYLDLTTGTRKWCVWNTTDPNLFHEFDRGIAYQPPARAPRLNQVGQVAGMFDTRDGGAGGAFLYTPNSPLKVLPTVDYYMGNNELIGGLNDDGMFSGSIQYKPTKGPTGIYVYRCEPGGTPTPDTRLPVRSCLAGLCMNADRDITLRQTPPYELRGYKLFHDFTQYLFTVEDLVNVDGMSSDDKTLWQSRTEFFVWAMTDRFSVDSTVPSEETVGCLSCTVDVPAVGTAPTRIPCILTPEYSW